MRALLFRSFWVLGFGPLFSLIFDHPGPQGRGAVARAWAGPLCLARSAVSVEIVDLHRSLLTHLTSCVVTPFLGPQDKLKRRQEALGKGNSNLVLITHPSVLPTLTLTASLCRISHGDGI